MKQTILIILLLGLSGCSFYESKTFYEINNNSFLSKVEVYDWSESGTIAGVSIGSYGPPIYAYTFNSDYYVLYPVLVKRGVSIVGPPILPVIPNSVSEKTISEYNLYQVRYYSPDSTGINPPKSLTIIQDQNRIETCLLKKRKTDAVGKIYSCTLKTIPEKLSTFELELLLISGHKKVFNMNRNIYTEYSPLTSFNGPDPKPSIVILNQ